jgi:hypothetical protein
MVRAVKQCIPDPYTKAGTLKRCGEGIVLEISGGRFYLLNSDSVQLSSGQSAGLMNDAGEEEGNAWLSPLREEKKQDLVSNIHGRIFVVRWREVQRIMNGQIHIAKVLEYTIERTNRDITCSDSA